MSKILAFNWKTNPNSLIEAKLLFESYSQSFETLKTWQKIVFPPAVYLAPLQELQAQLQIDTAIGSQDISEFESGAHTAQISGAMLADLGCEYSLIGHSETRSELFYTSFDTANKIKISLKNNINPILCVGFEPQSDNQNINWDELKLQITQSIEPNLIEFEKLSKFIIAYEPSWAIGSGETPTLAQIQAVITFIKEVIKQDFSEDLSQKTRILYGGSVSADNVSELAQSELIDGFLIGGASLVPEKVKKIVEQLAI